MRSICNLFLLFVSLFAAFSLSAKTKKAKQGKVYLELVEAYTRETVSGIKGVPSEANTYIVIVWRNNVYPETFFWRGNGGWLPCKTEKAHKVTAGEKNIPTGIDYITERVRIDGIKAGDTLLLTTMRGGKFPIPAEIKDHVKNILFFKTNGSGLIAFPIKAIKMKPPLSMP